MFQGVRQGGLFYVLDKGENPSLRVGQVTSVSNQYQKNNQFGAMPMYGAQDMVVDVCVKIGEDVMEFKQLNAALSIANSGSLVVSDSREAMCGEVEGMLHNSQQVIDSISYHKRVVECCDTMLRDLNPQFAKEKEQEEKIGALEERMGNIDDKLSKMFSLLSDTLEQRKKRD